MLTTALRERRHVSCAIDVDDFATHGALDRPQV
jgi:hypothetical protein